MLSSTQKMVATSSSDGRLTEPGGGGGDFKEEPVIGGVAQSRCFGSERDPPIYLPNLYVSDTHIGHNKGHEIFPGEWDDFSLYAYTEESDTKYPGIYNHNATTGFNGYGGGISPRIPGGVGFQDREWGVCEGSRTNGLWSDWPKPFERHHPLSLGPQQPRSLNAFGSCSLPYKDSTLVRGIDQVGIPAHAGYKFGTNVGLWHDLNYGRHVGLQNLSSCSCCSGNDGQNEHNRGPRSSKSKGQVLSETYSNKNIPSAGKFRNSSYEDPDFIVQYEDAKFFVIKSYSEDNIHKSIKYGVWASTPNGNQKLNTAYHEANEKLNSCPIFLFFSVNASAQFCGVAEMVGPVDFEKSVDYWQQDKWSGQLPVKWHIIKDVPNSQFRHIVLENNDNKPVTNSRDTQEVKLEQGVEMLNIFKNYDTNISILDDFDYYEDRQKALQERKTKEHNSLPVLAMDAGTENRNVVTESSEVIKKMSKSFAQVVRLK